MEKVLSRPVIVAALVSLVAFVVYCFTLAPGVDFIDSGELATVCRTLGIAHPTGYPLFTLIGWVFSHLPIASSIIVRLNLMAALFTALGAGAVVMLAHEIVSYWMPARPVRGNESPRKGKHDAQRGTQRGAQRKGVERKGEERRIEERKESTVAVETAPANGSTRILAAAAAGVAAAFSETWWSQSTGIEVYPVHLFLVPMMLTFFLRMLRNEEGEKPGRDGLLFALTLGVGFTNHMTTVLLAPATLYAFFARYGLGRTAWMRIARMAVPFVLALAIYLYLPIRSSEQPLMDWGHPATVGLFLKHITGGQYKIWMFASKGAAARNFAYFLSRTPKEFSIFIVLAIGGVVALFSAGSVRRVSMLLFSVLLLVGCVVYAINYDIHDIDSYFLLAYLVYALWIGAGVLFVTRLAQRSIVAPVLAALLAVGLVATNYSSVDESGNHMVDDYTRNMLQNLPPNAIIFSSQWDFWISGSFYYQLVEQMRPDVLVVDNAMLRDRPWYYELLMKRAPEVFRRAQPEMDNFLRYLRAFDEGRPFDEAAIAPAYAQFTQALVGRNLDRPIFITQEMLDQRDELFAPGMKMVPAGLAYRLVPRDTTFEVAVPTIVWRDAHYRKRNYYTDDARILQATPLANYASVLLRQGDKAGAARFLDAALRFRPAAAQAESGGAFFERDQEIAEAANQRFAQIEALRRQIQ